MNTAKVFTNGQSQAIRLPKACRFEGEEVFIKKVGKMVLLYPKDKVWEEFLSVPPVSDDVGEAILKARHNSPQELREQF